MIPLIISLLIGILPTSSHAEDIRMQDFSAAYYLEVERDSAIHSVQLPKEIYDTIIQEDLGDICIFNGNGDPVPQFLRTIEGDGKVSELREAIAFFPIYYTKQHPARKEEDLSIRVSRDRSGTIVNVSPLYDTQIKTDSENSYLLDLSDVKQRVSELEFFWDMDDSSTLINLSIEQSDDFIQWSNLVSKASLADIEFKGRRVIKRKIAIGVKTKKYLKLRWQPLKHKFKVKEVYGHFSNLFSKSGFYWTEAISSQQVSKENHLVNEFKLEKKIEPELAQIIFQETPALMKLQVLSKKQGDKDWNPRCNALFYDFRIDTAGISNGPCFFPVTKDNMWKIEQSENVSHGFSALSDLKIKLGWRRHEIVFVSQGDPPFLLAYGSGKHSLKKRTAENDMILQALQEKPMNSLIQSAGLLEKIVLGGELALRPPASPLPWKKWILWMVLIAGVSFLAYMVRNLMSDIKNKQGG